MSNITLEQARKVVEAAIQKSNDIGGKMNIAIVDAGMNWVAFNKMGDAWLGSIDISQKNADSGLKDGIVSYACIKQI